jgi:rubrerythrin
MESAIVTAMELEARVRDIYADACNTCADSAGKRVFQMLRDDEQSHYDYLKRRLTEIQQKGAIHLEPIQTPIPDAGQIQTQLAKLKKTLAQEDRGVLQQLLSHALKAELQTSDYYREMIAEFTGPLQEMFIRFLEIEDAHVDAVQAELDYVMHTGYWFDFKEFDME